MGFLDWSRLIAMPLFIIIVCGTRGLASPSPQNLVLVVPFELKKKATQNFKTLVGQPPSQVILTNSLKTPADSTVDIVKFLREQQTPSQLVCFDRAAADCVDALLLYPKLQAKVVQLVSLQGKVLGDERSEGVALPDVHDIEAAGKLPLTTAIPLLLGKIKEWLFPRSNGTYAMNPQKRRAYLAQVENRLKMMSQRVDLISVDSSAKKYGVIPHSKTLKASQFEKKPSH